MKSTVKYFFYSFKKIISYANTSICLQNTINNWTQSIN